MLKGVDVFGTTQITAELIQQRFGNELEALVQAIAAHKDQAFMDSYAKITGEIQAMGDFAYVSLSPIMYYDRGNSFYLTVDVVDQRDKARRLNFLAPPAKRFADPDGLLAKWSEYQETGRALAEKGDLELDKMHCPAFHCVWGFAHPKLKKYEKIFQTRVPKNKEKLKAILHGDERETYRANAAFLLAHISDPHELVNAVLPAIRDADATVRNNVMRVLSQIAEERREVLVPIRPFLDALDFPDTSDRNKSLATLEGLAARPDNKAILLNEAGPRLIQILRLLQPNNHDFAYAILKKISGKDFGERNYEAWDKWLRDQTGKR
jgi:hypothetical protein